MLLLRFNDDTGSERTILPQYDDPVVDEVKFLSCYFKRSLVLYMVHFSFIGYFLQGLTLDARGRFTGEAEKKLEEVMVLHFGFV